MSGRMKNGAMDPPLRKRLVDLENRRKALIDAMSKFQESKKSVLYHFLTENTQEPDHSSVKRNEDGKSICDVRQDCEEERNDSSGKRVSKLDVSGDTYSNGAASFRKMNQTGEEEVNSKLASDSSGVNLLVPDEVQKETCSQTASRSWTLTSKETHQIPITEAPSDESVRFVCDENRKHTDLGIRNDHVASPQRGRDPLMELKKVNRFSKSKDINDENSIRINSECADNQDCKVDAIYLKACLSKASGRSNAKIIDVDENMRKFEGGDVNEIEDNFLKLFADNNAVTRSNEADQNDLLRSDRQLNADTKLFASSFENASCSFGNHTQVGFTAKTTKEFRGDCDRTMTILEKKLNMMISKKPLWQKILQDLNDEPLVGNKMSMSVSIFESDSKTNDPPGNTAQIGVNFHSHKNINDSKNIVDFKKDKWSGNHKSSVESQANKAEHEAENGFPRTLKNKGMTPDEEQVFVNPTPNLEPLPSNQQNEVTIITSQMMDNYRHIDQEKKDEVATPDEPQSERDADDVEDIETTVSIYDVQQPFDFLRSNKQKEAETESPYTVGTNNIFSSSEREQMILDTEPFQLAERKVTKSVERETTNSLDCREKHVGTKDVQSTQPIGDTESTQIADSGDLAIGPDSTCVCSQSTNPKKSNFHLSRSVESNDIALQDAEQMILHHAGQLHNQPNLPQSNRCNMNDVGANLKTPPVSNVRKQFFYRCDDVGNVDVIRDHNSKAKHRFSGSDKFHFADQLQSQNRANLRNCTGFGVTSELSDSSTDSSATSSSSDCSSETTCYDKDDKDDIDDDESGDSPTKPPIPNEVTMLTDFTVQSITCSSNSSIIESLGDESLMRGPVSRFLCTSNSESAVIEERNDLNKSVNENVNTLQLVMPAMSYTEGLREFLTNPTILCQCTGPVILNDIVWSYPDDDR